MSVVTFSLWTRNEKKRGDRKSCRKTPKLFSIIPESFVKRIGYVIKWTFSMKIFFSHHIYNSFFSYKWDLVSTGRYRESTDYEMSKHSLNNWHFDISANNHDIYMWTKFMRLCVCTLSIILWHWQETHKIPVIIVSPPFFYWWFFYFDYPSKCDSFRSINIFK